MEFHTIVLIMALLLLSLWIYNYIIKSRHIYHTIFLIKPSSKNATSNKMWLLLLPVQKQTAKRHASSAQFRDCGRAKETQNLGQQWLRRATGSLPVPDNEYGSSFLRCKDAAGWSSQLALSSADIFMAFNCSTSTGPRTVLFKSDVPLWRAYTIRYLGSDARSAYVCKQLDSSGSC